MTVDEKQVLQVHRQHFGVEGCMFAAPARVNLIGEHTDYTGGLVMPMAIDFRTRSVLSAREDRKAIFYSENYAEEACFNLDEGVWARREHWSDYPAGVAWLLMQGGIPLRGFSMTLSGDVPLGAGLSSSASVEVAAAIALLDYAAVELPLPEIATLCRRAENEYVGAKTGIMDQFVVLGATEHRAMMIDCRSLEFELLPLPEDVRVVICNSMVKHRLADVAGYGDRRGEVEAGQAVLRRERPGIELLRDATLADLEACKGKMSAESFARCRHIITENTRVIEAKEALLRSDLVRFGELMVQAHASFRDDFAASCAEVDTLVEIALRQGGCYGGRITGGGFGGCTVNLVEAKATDRFVESVRQEYAKATGIAADCFVCTPSDGALALAAAKKGSK